MSDTPGPTWPPTSSNGGPTPPTSPTPPAGAQPPASEPAGAGRPRWLLPVAIVAGVVVVAGVVTGIVVATNSDDEATPAPSASTTILPVPTPAVSPIARDATTPFATSLPTSVLQYALAETGVARDWIDHGALEAYADRFTDGADGTAAVESGQWATVDEATAFFGDLVKQIPSAASLDLTTDTPTEGPAEPEPTGTPDPSASPATPWRDRLPQVGPVLVGGERVGTYVAADEGAGTGVVVWTNGTAVFRAEVPVADVLDFYRAFPV